MAYTRREIAFTSTESLEARLEELVDDAEESFPNESDVIEKELESRWYANHEDARVRQAMGYE